ncbi:MAG TPA: TldD/PmbA family protein, partial [Gemmatimonadales bacterium]
MPEWFTRDEARRLTRRVLELSNAEGCQVSLTSGLTGNTRSAVDGVTTSGDVWNARLTVTSRFARRSASGTTNRFDDQSLRRAVEASEKMARLAPEDPEMMPLVGPQPVIEVPALARATVKLDGKERARAAGVVLEAARDAGLSPAGFITREVSAVAIANSAGLFTYHLSSLAGHGLTVRTPDGTGSGWAGTVHNDWKRTRSPADLARRAIGKAALSRAPAALGPGKYTVVLEAQAVANLLPLMTWSMDARAADEGRSFFSRLGGGNRIGERVVDPRVTIVSDPSDPDLLESPYTGEGAKIARTVWVEEGVVRNLAYSRYWADRQGVTPRPTGGGIRMTGTEASLDDLIAQVERGLLVTRFWYIRGVDPRTILHTGLTRDGVFLIEKGKVTRAVNNFRFNESPITMLNNLVALGRPERVPGTESGGADGSAIVVPPIVTRDFH